MTRPISLFYSYAHEDEVYRDKLETHLSTLRNQGIIQQWHDRKIDPGKLWEQEIDARLEQANLILLLISADFLASDFCNNKEMTRALTRHHNNEARVIPVHIRPVDWQGSPFAALQSLPTDARPVTSWANEDEAFTDIARGIRRAAEQLRGDKVVPEPPKIPGPLPVPAKPRPYPRHRIITGVIVLLVAATGGSLAYRNYASVSQHLQNGKQYLDLREMSQAREEYQLALTKSWFPRQEAHLGLLKTAVFDPVDSEFNSQVVEQRIADLQRQYPDDAHAYMFLGILHAAQSHYKEAEAAYRKALELDPDIPYLYHGLGIVYDQTGRAGEALDMHRKAVARAPSNQDYLINLADQYVRRGDYGIAVETFTEALNKGGDYVLAYLEFASYYRQQDQPGNALNYHENATKRISDDSIAQRPKNTRPWYFAIDDKQINLDSLNDKRCYVNLSLASLYQQLELTEKAAQTSQNACSAKADKANIQWWVDFETKYWSAGRH